MNHGGVYAFAIEALGDAFGAALGTGKDQHASGLFAQQLLQHGLFAVGWNFKCLQADVFRRLEG